jgi:hypothetical protein
MYSPCFQWTCQVETSIALLPWGTITNMKIDVSGWPTKEEARGILDLSMSQINNLVKAKRLEVRMRKRPGLPPVGVVNPADVERERGLRANIALRPHVLPSEAPGPAPAIDQRRPRFLLGDVSSGLHTAPLVPLASKLWLSYDEAIAFSGLGKSRLHELVGEGKIATERGSRGSVVLRRVDLERLSGLLS